MRQRWARGRFWGAAAIAAVVVMVVPAGSASGAFDAKLKRYPYLTDLTTTSVGVNFGTDISATSAVVKYGPAGGSCNTSTATATRTFILVNGVSEYQWRAQLTGLAADSEYCYRPYFGSAQLNLLGTDPSPVFRTQIATGSSAPFKFAVFGDWGKTLAAGNPDQANVISQIAASGARFAVTTGDNAYEVGSQKDYGDLYQTGDNTSAVFGPNFWKVAGASLPLFPAIGNHDHNNSTLLTNWPQETVVAASGGRYQTDTYCCQNGTTSMDYPSGWYAFDAGMARFYVLTTAWDDSNAGTATSFENDFDNHWGPSSPQYQWLANDLATHPRAVRFAFWHYPFDSDSSEAGPDTFLQGANSLEGLLNQYDVTAGFSGHSHNYQRNTAPPGGIPTHITGGGGANLESIGAVNGCSAIDAYGIGWSSGSNVGSACGAGPVPATKDRVHHFLIVSVAGTSVTVTPTDELGRTFDPITYNAAAQDADLSLTKTDSPDPVLVGQPITYTLTVGNAGPRDATDVQVTDTLPAGMIFDSATPSQGSCSQASGTVTCELGTVADGAGASITIEGRPQSSGTISNTATVASSVNDPDSSDNTATASTTVDPAADLAVTNTDSPDPVTQGQQLTYTVGVANAGPSSATGITLTDTLPAGVTFNSATPSQGSCSQASGTVTCSLGTLANTASASVSIKVTPPSAGSITNQANVTSLTADPNTANNGAAAQTTVASPANLSLTLTDTPDPVLAGALLTYNITVHNSGPGAPTATSVTDTLPASMVFDSATPSQGTCAYASPTITCGLGALANGANATVQIKVRPQTTGHNIPNSASVASELTDPSPGNNTASTTTNVNPGADLALTKTDSPDPVGVGQQLTYTLGVSNAGPSIADDVKLTDNLPAGVTYNSATPSQGTCSQKNGKVTCSLGNLASAASAAVSITVTPPSTGVITNSATVDAHSAGDPVLTNNSASATTNVRPLANLSLTKSDSPDPVLAGQLLTYSLSVANAGPSSTTGVTVTDTLPAGVTFNSATPSQGTCSQSSGTVTCSLGTIANGQGAGVQISVTPQNAGLITNEASVSSDNVDLVPGNNSAAASTTVNPAADLSIVKSDSPDPVSAGQQLTYTLGIGNAGPSAAADVTVTDTLPAGVTFDSATASQGTCSQSAGTVTCSLGAVGSGATPSVEIKITPSSGGTITNQATVSSPTSDPVLVNNAASASTTVDPVADLSLTKTDSPDPVLDGQLLTYSLSVANAGPSSATGVQLTDNLPAGVTFESATPSQGTCSQSSGTVTCALGTIGGQAGATIEIKIRPSQPGTINNQAQVSSGVQDPDSANNGASAETTVDPAADLSLTKTDSPDPVLAGQPLTYSLSVANAGPSGATGVTVTDTLPAGVRFNSATPSQGTCSQSSGTVTCPLGTIADGEGATVEISVTPASAGEITNEASVSSDAADLVPGNNSAGAVTTVDPAADVSIVKSDSPDPVLAGQLLTYSLSVANAGPSSATGVELTDTLPAGVTFDSATPSQGTCSESSGTVTCSLGTIADGEGATVEIAVRPSEPGTITNDATVSATTADPIPLNNTSSAGTTVESAADLSLTKSDAPDPVLAGQLLTYTLTAHNAGPQDATGVELTDTLPAGVTFDSSTPSQGSCSQSSGTVTCSLGTISADADAAVEIKVTPGSGGTITNEATVSATTADPVLVNNSASATTTVDPVADLSLTNADSPDPVIAGELLTYTLTADNAGPDDATGVELTDTLPAGVTFDSATPSQGTCSESSGTVTCALGTLADQGSATVEIKVAPSSGGTITNHATVSATTADPVLINNVASAETTVDPAANLSLTKSDSPDPVLAGQILTYTLTAHNAGPDDATGVELTDTLPAGVTYDSATPSQGSCSQSTGTVTCSLGTIAAGAGASVEIKVVPSSGGTITNQAQVTSGVHDPDSANNSADADTTVDPLADLSLTITDSPDPVLAGQLLTYTLTANNAGPDDATGVELTDTLPAGVTFDSATPSQGSCSQSSGTVTCSLGAISVDADATVEIKVTPGSGGTITNGATMSATTADPVLVNNGASESTTVDPLADLSLTNTDSPDPVLAGHSVVYTLTAHNAGPDDATGVELTDTLPAGVTYDSATPSQGTCSESSGTVTCSLGTIPNGQGAGVDISVTPEDAGDITNEATIGSATEDPNLDDNSATAVTTVLPVADLELTKSDSPDPVAAGRPLTYTLTVHNAGPQDATGVELTDTLPAGVTFDSATPSQGTCSESSGTVTCALGTLADQGSATVEIKVRRSQPGTITNQAEVTSGVHDPDSANNSASAETTVDPAADLSLTKSDAPDPVLAGELLVYTLTAHNAGPQDAAGIQLTDNLPAGVTFDSATPSQGTCSESSGTVMCALGTIADQAGATVEIKARPSTAGTITNEASLGSSTGDPNSANNSASAGTTVRATPVGYARPLGATPVAASLVPAYAECTVPNRTHGPPLDSASCNPPAQRSSFLTAGTPDANSKPANMTATMRFSTIVGAAATPADEADVAIAFQATDIRNRTGLTDYTGELQGQVLLRITDRLNGATGRDSATTADVSYTFTVPCTPTGGTADVGATCSLNTTADAITPGTVTETKRTIWEMRDVAVLDGGADGAAETAGNTVFLRQGVFIP